MRPSTMVKLSDLEWPLPSLLPVAIGATYGCGAGRPLVRPDVSCGVELLPIGVAKRNWGGAGRDDGRETGCSGASSGTAPLPETGF